MRTALLLGLLACVSVACATATDSLEENNGSGGAAGASSGGATATGGGTSSGGVFGNTGGMAGGSATGGTTATGGAASGGAASGGTSTGGGATITCEDAVDWVGGQHSVNYPPGQLFNYMSGVYRYDGTQPMTFVNADCPPDQSGQPWCQTGDYPWSVVTDC